MYQKSIQDADVVSAPLVLDLVRLETTGVDRKIYLNYRTKVLQDIEILNNLYGTVPGQQLKVVADFRRELLPFFQRETAL